MATDRGSEAAKPSTPGWFSPPHNTVVQLVMGTQCWTASCWSCGWAALFARNDMAVQAAKDHKQIRSGA